MMFFETPLVAESESQENLSLQNRTSLNTNFGNESSLSYQFLLNEEPIDLSQKNCDESKLSNDNESINDQLNNEVQQSQLEQIHQNQLSFMNQHYNDISLYEQQLNQIEEEHLIRIQQEYNILIYQEKLNQAYYQRIDYERQQQIHQLQQHQLHQNLEQPNYEQMISLQHYNLNTFSQNYNQNVQENIRANEEEIISHYSGYNNTYSTSEPMPTILDSSTSSNFSLSESFLENSLNLDYVENEFATEEELANLNKDRMVKLIKKKSFRE